MQSPETVNPCITCGACCATYRASFYWAEADDRPGGTVPVEVTEKLNDFRRVMRGTNQKNPRCIALLGEIGKSVGCSIYELRSSVCRDFDVSWIHGVRNERCDQARIAWGLEPLPAPCMAPETSPDDPQHTAPPNRPPLPRAA
ncbi:YkgJ family cysteine cluster protein [Anaerobaca lacustris]|uniref:YkgJ family cysteine cluster protein n=1 Tax=Anaerobaca lacustris TaxID=3044600 RepID=A0AAW6TX49_9BACT|nr:YkgJ family cysteine cluster protein [Sedimentisphaerales bacterium M17dextr]